MNINNWKKFVSGLAFAASFAAMTGQAADAASTGPCPTPRLYTTLGLSPSGGNNQPYINNGGLCNILLTFQNGGGIQFDVVNPQPFDGIDIYFQITHAPTSEPGSYKYSNRQGTRTPG